MTSTQSSVALVARILLAFMFIVAGFSKLGDLQGTMSYTASGGLPGVFAVPAIALEILGGLAILVGFQDPVGWPQALAADSRWCRRLPLPLGCPRRGWRATRRWPR